VDEEVGSRVLGPHPLDVARADPGVDVALAVPDVQGAADPLLDVGAEEHVGPEQDLGVRAVLAQDVLDDGDGVRRGDAVVRERLDLGRGVDVHHGDRARMARLPGAQLLGRDAVGQRAAGVEVRDEHALVGAQDRRRLGHEVHAAEGDDGGVGLGRLLGEAERVADVVGYVLDLRTLVVVGEDHGVALTGERTDLGLQLAHLVRGQLCGRLRRGKGGHGQVHGWRSRMRERSRVAAEWVSAPTDT
jgi:hypothetical protein